MDLLTTLRIMARHWYVVASGVVLTIVAAIAVFQSIDPTYEARGTALVVAPLPPDGEATVNSQNPFTRFDSSTSVFAGVATMLMDDIQTREALGNRGVLPDYQIFQLNQSVPLLTVVTQDKDEARTLDSAVAVLHAINDELNQRQADAGAPEESRIRSIVITEPARAVRLVTDSMRAALLTAALGVAASISLAFIAESYAKSRSRRREHAADASALEDASGADHVPEAREAARRGGDDIDEVEASDASDRVLVPSPSDTE